MDNGTHEYQLCCLTTEDVNVTSRSVEISQIKKDNTVLISSLMFAFGVFGNVVALIVLSRSDQKRKLFYRLVGGLTLTDLIGTVATSPVVISVYVNDFKWIGGYPLCQYFAFMMIFSGTGTMLHVCFMAVERLICIRHPYMHHTHLRLKHASYFVGASWTIAATIAALPLMGFGKIVLQHPCTWCFIDYYTDDTIHRGYNYLFAILALTTILVTVSCNVVVLYTLFRTKMRGLSRNRGNSRQFVGYSRRYADCQMPVLLIGISAVFSSCYLPLMVRILINQTKLLPVDKATDLVMIRLASMNQILDPWVYILLRRELIWRIGNTVKSLCISTHNPAHEYQEGTSDFRRQSGSGNTSAGVQYNENPNCCVFCWHCMCEPPRQQTQNSSFMSNIHTDKYIRPNATCSSLVPLSPTRREFEDVTADADYIGAIPEFGINGQVPAHHQGIVELLTQPTDHTQPTETLLYDGSAIQWNLSQPDTLGGPQGVRFGEIPL